MPLLLELFCGTKSVGKVASEYGYDVLSVDIDAKCKPDVCIDIMQFDYLQYEPGHFDIIWASVPCNTFSKYNLCNYTREVILQRQRKYGLPLLNKTLEIIDHLQPRLYCIENPRGMMHNYIDEKVYPKFQADYCQYGCEYRKPTNFWTNRANIELKICKGIYCKSANPVNRRRHLSCVSKTPLSVRYSIPPDLIRVLCFE